MIVIDYCEARKLWKISSTTGHPGITEDIVAELKEKNFDVFVDGKTRAIVICIDNNPDIESRTHHILRCFQSI